MPLKAEKRRLAAYRSSACALVVFVIAAVFATSTSQALDVKSPGPDWTETYHRGGLVIFTKDVEADHEIIAVSEVDAPPETVFNVVSDFEHYPDFMPYVEESRVLSRKSDREVITYARIAPPFVSERDYPLHVRMTRGSLSNGRRAPRPGRRSREWCESNSTKAHGSQNPLPTAGAPD